MALFLTVSSLQRSHYILRTQRVDQVISVLPKIETEQDPADYISLFRTPRVDAHTKHDWIEVADALSGDDSIDASSIAGWKRDLPKDFPEYAHVRDLIGHLQHAIDRGNRMDSWHLLIHCHGGVSRSTAAAYIGLCMIYGVDASARCAELLPTIIGLPHPDPNILLVHYADQILGGRGKMTRAIIQLKHHLRTANAAPAIAHAR